MASRRFSYANVPAACSYCPKVFPNLQALGGHMTSHREEIAQMRKQHDFLVAGMELKVALSVSTKPLESSEEFRTPQAGGRKSNFNSLQASKIPFLLLAPNRAFWELYWRYGQVPPLIDFMGVNNKLSIEVEQYYSVEKKQPWVPDHGGDKSHTEMDSEDTLTAPMAPAPLAEEQGEEALSLDLQMYDPKTMIVVD